MRKSNKIDVSISYWTYPEGDDFEGIEEFESEVYKEFNVDIEKQRTDALGGGLYEFVIEIIQNEDLQDFATDFLKDLGKVVVLKSFKLLFKNIKTLFKKNNKFRPDIEKLSIKFLDTIVVIYPIYENSIQDVFDDLLESIANNYADIKKVIPNKISFIHIPIFDKIDTYSGYQYRVKLNVDETIEKFSKKDYLKLWGVKTEKNNYVYDIDENILSEVKFSTQDEYDDSSDNVYES